MGQWKPATMQNSETNNMAVVRLRRRKRLLQCTARWLFSVKAVSKT